MYPRRDQPYPIPPTIPPTANSSPPPPPPSSSSSTVAATTTPNPAVMQLPPGQPPQQQQQQPQQQQQQQQYSNGNALQGYTGQKNGRIYSLKVEQQPIRARMCGFGDKDRRPITPPPCIRLIVTDASTGKEIDTNEVDSTFFVLTVDLWSADGSQEVNLVRHSSGAPTVSISTSTTTSYPPPPDRPSYMGMAHAMIPSYRTDAYAHPMGAPPVQMPGYGAAPSPIQQGYYPPTPVTPATPVGFSYGGAPGGQPYAPIPMPMPPAAPATGMFTRNLIGSLTVNAFKLNDTDGKVGFWFVLQDLSVRTEGNFRLKMNFVDVGSGNGTNTLNTGKAPVLASCFSDVFQVYSAKKFPGVIESTPLSKAFASQGIKIPIRKDGPKVSNAAEYENDE